MNKIIQNNNIDLLHSSKTSSEVITRLCIFDRLVDGIKIWNQVLFFEIDLHEYFKHPHPYITIERFFPDGGLLAQLNIRVGRGKKRLSGYVIFIPTSQPTIYRAISVCESAFWNKGVRKFLETCYPKLLKVSIRQEELKTILFSLEENISSKFNVKVKDFTVKERRHSVRADDVEKYDSGRKWTESAIESAFADARENSQWFNSLRIAFCKKNRVKAEAYLRISKYGQISQDHLFDITNELIFPLLDRFAYDKTALFAKRGLKDRNYRPSPPLSITYDMDIFNDTKNVRQLVHILKKLPNTSKAIYHGNPYLHMSIADFLDGSSYEIWVLSPRKILIIPQIHTSIQSLEKIVTFIFDNFREGVISEVIYG